MSYPKLSSLIRRPHVTAPLAAAALACVSLTLLPHSSHSASATFEWPIKDRQPTPAELSQIPAVIPEKAAALLKDVRAPQGFQVSIFATPPAVNYPVFVSASVDGTLYVSSDGNGSLDRKPHLGRVLRVRDTNNDGQADEVKAFIPDVDSPRGLVWDRDRLYLLHPPDISVFLDRDHDGVAEEKQTLVSGIGWTFKDRPADHASNGLELGIDGWLYAAIGDFGFMEARGTDGRKLQLRGGGVIRVRPDGTGLELWADGTRNILETATSPLLDLFARDNTNDGGGWDVRFHHFSGRTQHGYPRLFKNFPGEFLEPLADYGGGSGCGAGWLDEPGWPASWNNAPYTADWGRDMIYHHGLTPRGATFTVTQQEFLKLPRPTDLDVDGQGALYASSWKGASFTWVGPDVGFIARVTPQNAPPQPALNLPLEKATSEYLVELLSSPSHSRRLAAQRELIPRLLDARSMDTIRKRVTNPNEPIASRIAALFLLKQKQGINSHRFITPLLKDPTIAAWAIRALTDRENQLREIPVPDIKTALTSHDPRTRKEAALAMARLGDLADGPGLTRLLTDPDPVVAHSALQVLIQLKDSKSTLAAFQDSSASEAQRLAPLRVLQSLHTPEVVTALIHEFSQTTQPNLRQGLITTLCRLHFIEGPWKGDSWGTRPDTRGPFYQPTPWSESKRISDILLASLQQAGSTEAAHIGRELARHRIPAGPALDSLIQRASTDSSLLPAIASQLAQEEEIPPSAIPLLTTALTSPHSSEAVRAQAVIALSKSKDAAAWKAILSALPTLAQAKSENNLVEKAQSAVKNAAHLDQLHEVFEIAAHDPSSPGASFAEETLFRLASRKVGSPEARAAAQRALDAGWKEGAPRKIQMLKAAARTGDTSRAQDFVKALTDPNPQVAQAARETIQKLKIDPKQFEGSSVTQKISDLKTADVLKQILNTRGEASRGEQLFNQVGCNACHTIRKDEPLKGPYLGTIANVYRRKDLAEAILVPSKTIAQGFAANHFTMKDGAEWEGFVVREASDEVIIRTIAAQELTLPVKEIAQREKLERSLMPEGLAANLTLQEFASLLDFIESLAKSP